MLTNNQVNLNTYQTMNSIYLIYTSLYSQISLVAVMLWNWMERNDASNISRIVDYKLAVNFVGLEDLVADIRTLEYISNSYALAEGLHCEVSPGEVRCI